MLIKWNENRRWVQDSLLTPQRFESFHSDLLQARWHTIVCVECLWMIKLIVVGFCFIGVWSYSDECGIWYHLYSFREVNGSRVIPRLYGWVYKTLRLSPLVVEHSAVVTSVRLNALGSQFSVPLLWNLCSESVRYKTLRPSWGLWHW